MKFKIIILSYIFCFLFGAESPAYVSNDNGFNYTVKNNGNALVKFTNPEYAFEEVSDKNGKAYKKPNFSNSSSISAVGAPDLQSRTTFIAVDPSKSYSLQVSYGSSRVIENIDIAPKGDWNELGSDRSISESDYSNIESFYPAHIALLSEPMAMRELSLVSLTVSPFRYFPQEKRLEEFIIVGKEKAMFLLNI